MSAEAWDVLVRRLEARASRDPKSYRMRVAAMAALGYLYLGAILAVVLAGSAWAVYAVATGHPIAIKLLIVLGILAFTILRALPVRLEPPTGIALMAADAPELFALVERLRAEASAPPIHHLLLDGQLNAGVAQVPRFGWFGPTRNYLVVGLPLLAALSEEEFTAVVAHELGHVSGKHGHFSAWIYRVRQTWDRVLSRLEEGGHWAIWLFRRFFRWYAPYFSAYSFVLTRGQEYEADRAAAAAAGPRAAGSALARLELVSRYLDETYWPSIYREAESSPTPNVRPLDRLFAWFRSDRPSDALVPFAEAALERSTDAADAHPALTARLEAFGLRPSDAVREAATRSSASAAERFLGETSAALVARLDDEWCEGVADWWRVEHEGARSARARFEELERADAKELDAEALSEKARLMHHFHGREAALPAYRAALERDPANAVANYVVGEALLEAGDETGLRHLDRAMQEEPEAILPGSELAESFLVARGRADEAEHYRARRFERLDALADAGDERRVMKASDHVVEHDRSAEEIAALVEQLKRHPEVKTAYFARRALAHLADEYPSYVLAVDIPIRSWKLHVTDPRVEVPRRLAAELDLPFECFVVELKGGGKLTRRIRKLPGAEIYRR
jgi:Zn-dependent protease with chaperone function